ncbi:unnamed protein product [Bursaphelenchus okinawaensis]|uniref:G_PROTEIN_RECEP_F1_2 domain-containing protein n=1 Tax=Bursaphelenchus okinawaensis TaxID=465554 RepID=A0A811L0B6_9BILA|nr:unnamed protein product [Bursaphelenchus okinawaensis]CAG9115177.1 unnamed protein product [Bursaphelenchus okinawaensis]
MYCDYYLEFVKWCYRITTGVGPLVSLVLLFIIYKTRKSVLKDYQTILVLYCIHDLLFEIVCLLSYLQSNIKVDVLIIGTRFGVDQPQSVAVMAALYLYSMYMLLFMLLVSCHCRYNVLKNVHNTNKKQWITSYVTINVLSILSALLTIYVLLEEGNVITKKYRDDICFGESTKNYLEIDTKKLRVRLLIGKWLLTLFIVYGIAVWYGAKTLKLLSSSAAKYSTRTLTTQRQLTKVIIIQGLIPMITSVGPLSVTCLCIIFVIDPKGMEVTLYGCVSWIPVLNALSTIVFIKQYRQFIVRIWRTKKFNHSVTSRTSYQ